MADVATKYTLTYRKCWEARFLSHLELLRTTQRAFRRSGLPLLFSSGFNPRPRISFLTFPLPVGFTGEGERLEFALTEAVPDAEALAALREVFRVGIVPESLVSAKSETGDGAPKGAGRRISFNIFLLFESDSGLNAAPPEKIVLAEGIDALPAPWSEVKQEGVFAGPPQFKLDELFAAAYAAGPICGDVTLRPDRIVREALPAVRSLHVHRVGGE